MLVAAAGGRPGRVVGLVEDVRSADAWSTYLDRAHRWQPAPQPVPAGLGEAVPGTDVAAADAAGDRVRAGDRRGWPRRRPARLGVPALTPTRLVLAAVAPVGQADGAVVALERSPHRGRRLGLGGRRAAAGA